MIQVLLGLSDPIAHGFTRCTNTVYLAKMSLHGNGSVDRLNKITATGFTS
jgi:hypothetical protein